VASWPEGEAIDLQRHVAQLTQHLALELIFGGKTDQGCIIADLVSRLMEAKWSWSAFVPINRTVIPYGRIARECALLESLILEWAARKCGKLDDADLASIIVNSPGCDGAFFDHATIVGHLSTLVLTASEAAQTALTWMLLLLAQHPQIARELLDELQSALGAASPSLDGVSRLSYLDAVVKEAMRILPPVPILVRVAARDTAIAGHDLPAGTRALLSTFVTTRMPDLYVDGDVFLPQRWLTIAPNPFEFPVFGAGPHICPGYSFVLTLLKVALAAILTRFRLTLAPGVRVDYKVQPTLRLRSPLSVCLHRQDGAVAVSPLRGSITRLVRFPQ
jgi:cytochrome P450